MPELPVLRAAFGPYPALDRLRMSEPQGFRLEFADMKPISRAFAPMVREGAFDVSEMALGTALQALAYGKPLVLLPVVVAARFQEAALLCRADSLLVGPRALAGRRVGVRAYSQTTGIWLRGVLAEQHGVAPQDVRWVTFEGAHAAEYTDPAWTERAPAGADMLAMLRQGDLDAAIVGNDMPNDPGLRTVFPDLEAAREAFRSAYGFKPVNHIAVVRANLAAEQPGWVRWLVSQLPPGAADIRRAVPVMLRFLAAQALLPRPLEAGEVWAATAA